MKHVQHCLTIAQTPVEMKCQISDVFGINAPDREEYRPGRCYFRGTTLNQKMTIQCIRCEHYICRSNYTVT